MFQSSVCSYPTRGDYGKSSYRGNCSGLIVKDFIQTYLSRSGGLVADPSVGGGTSSDVAEELGVRFKGTDLHEGFNLLRDDFGQYLGEEANLIWWHPPYWNMVEYSGSQWGLAGEINKWDLSRLSLNDFVEALELSILNIHDACETRGHYAILMGNLRRQGEYYNLSGLVERLAPGQLVDEIIKTQHGCVSDRKAYAGKVVRIAHEKLLVFRRNNSASSLIILGSNNSRAVNLVSVTWKAAVRRVLQGKTLKLKQIYEAIAPYAQHRANNNWQAKVRQVVQDARYFERIEAGLYRLAA